MSKQRLQNAGAIIIAIGFLLFASGCKQPERLQTGVDAYSSFVSADGNISFPADFGSMPFCVERPCLISLMPG